MYAIRSIHNHGLATDAIDNADDPRAKLARQFRSRQGGWTIARSVAMHCIVSEAQQTAEDEGSFRFPSAEEELIDRFFRTDDRWDRFKSHFTGSGDARRLVELKGDEFVEFVNDCNDFRRNHDWSMMSEVIDGQKIVQLMRTTIALYGEASKNTNDEDAIVLATKLFHDASTDERNEWESWYQANFNYEPRSFPPVLSEVAKSISLHLYEYFVDPDMRYRWGPGKWL